MEIVVPYARSVTSELEVDRQFQMMQELLAPGVDVVGRLSDLGSRMFATSARGPSGVSSSVAHDVTRSAPVA